MDTDLDDQGTLVHEGDRDPCTSALVTSSDRPRGRCRPGGAADEDHVVPRIARPTRQHVEGDGAAEMAGDSLSVAPRDYS
jgi:hypothetical protein